MSGIAGICRMDGAPADHERLGRMLATLGHRGGDGAAAFQDGPVALGVQRFALDNGDAVAPRSAPMHSGSVIVFDGRLDGREALREALAVDRRDWPGVNDAQAALLAYAAWGQEAPQRLVGDFAFALWDTGRQRLLCARDGMGARPFYYAILPGEFLLSSEIKALLAHPGVGRDLDEGRIADYLHARFEDKEATFYRAIRRLPPGQSLIVEDGNLRRRFWLSDTDQPVVKDDASAADQLRQLLRESIQDRLRTALPLGFLVSGGLDSASVLALARKKISAQNSPPAYLATFPDFPDIDEEKWVDCLAEEIDFEKRTVRVDRIGPVSMLPRIYAHLDEPFHFPNLFIYWALGERARGDGCRVLLDGMDGDTTVSHGMERLAQLLARGRWMELWRQARALQRQFGQPAHRFVMHFAAAPVLSRLTSLAGPTLRRAPPKWMPPPFAARIGWAERDAQFRKHHGSPPCSAAEAHRRQVRSGLIPYHLEVYDQAAAALGLDHRHPYFDARLVAFCLAVPPRMKLDRGVDRAIQRQALGGVVPEPVRQRISKSNWSGNFERSIFRTDRQEVDRFVNAPGLLGDYVAPKELKMVWRRLQTAGRLSPGDGMLLWTSLSLGYWLRTCYHHG